MKFYRLSEIPYRGDDLVFKASMAGIFIWPVVYFGIAIALLVLGIDGTKIYGLQIPSGVLFYGGSAVFGLLGWVASGQVRARMKPTNWLLRCDGSGLIIKYRSFMNWRLPAEDVQVGEFNYSEIARIREVRKQRTTFGAQHSTSRSLQYVTYLDICLANDETSDLEAHLEAERKAESPGRFGALNYKSNVLDYPVEVLPGGIVRLRWSKSAGYKIKPSLTKAIAYLSRYVNTTATISQKVDLTQPSNLSSEEGDTNILKLVKSGDKTGAVKLTRKIYSCSLSEAAAFVDKLQSKG